MASWKDGAAYAPTERPDGFAAPVADPLPTAEAPNPVTPGPLAQPAGFETTQQPVLTELGRLSAGRRNPSEAFSVTSMAMTAGPEAFERRDPHAAFAPSSTALTSPDPAPPTGPPLPIDAGLPPTSWPAPLPTQKQSWPAPAPAGQQSWPPPDPRPSVSAPEQVPQRSQARRLRWIAAAVCGFGVVFSAGAPFLLIVAGLLGIRSGGRTSYLGFVTLIMGASAVVFLLLSGTLGNGSAPLTLLAIIAGIGFIVGAADSR